METELAPQFHVWADRKTSVQQGSRNWGIPLALVFPRVKEETSVTMEMFPPKKTQVLSKSPLPRKHRKPGVPAFRQRTQHHHDRQ